MLRSWRGQVSCLLVFYALFAGGGGGSEMLKKIYCHLREVLHLCLSNLHPFKRRIRTVMAFRAYYICSSLFLPKLINQRLLSLNANHLSFVGRVTLVKSVMQALPSHVMQTSFHHRAVYDKVDKKCWSFVWEDSEYQ